MTSRLIEFRLGFVSTRWSKIASCLPGRTDNEIKNVWNTHLKKRVSPAGGGEDRGAAGSKKKKKAAAGGGAEEPLPSPSPSSSTTTTTNCSSGDDSGEQQSNTSKEEPDDNELDLENLEMMPMLDDPTFGFDMLVDPVPPAPYGPAVSVSVSSPCASSTSPPPAPACAPPGVDDHLLVLPEIDIDHELWSIIDGDGDGDGDGGASACTMAAAEAPAPAPAPASCCQLSNAEPPSGGANTTSHGAEEGKEWWLEDLERELGLWGPVEDYQYPTGPHGLVADHPDPLPAMVDDPVSCYFQAGPASAMLQEPGYSAAAVTSSNQMGL